MTTPDGENRAKASMSSCATSLAEELLDSPDFDPTDCPWTRSGDALS